MLLREAGRYRVYNCYNLSQGILSFYFDLAVWQVSWTKFFTFLSLDCLLIRHQKYLLGSVANANEIILIKDLPQNQIYSKCACVFVYCCYFFTVIIHYKYYREKSVKICTRLLSPLLISDSVCLFMDPTTWT